MNLQTFKRTHALSLVELAKLLELPVPTTFKYVSGARKPENPERVLHIVAKTGGRVTAADLRPDWAAVFS